MNFEIPLNMVTETPNFNIYCVREFLKIVPGKCHENVRESGLLRVVATLKEIVYKS